jgi:enterochelin esterase-like enzyme
VCVVLHGRGEDHAWPFATLQLQRFLADGVQRRATPTFAIASIDGGDATNWHRRKNGDDPPKMITDEFLPRLAARGLRTDRFALWGWSLGGFGALLLASRLGPGRVAAVAAASPALWSAYGASGSGTFDGPADFAANNVASRTHALSAIALRVDCGRDDPFAGQVRKFRAAVTPTPAGGISDGCHDAGFWRSQAAAELAFVGTHLG